MSPFLTHPAFYNRPIRLEPEQAQQPMDVINRYFGAMRLAEVRETLGNLVETALVTDNVAFSEWRDRADLISFHEQLEMLVEACYLLSDKRLDKIIESREWQQED